MNLETALQQKQFKSEYQKAHLNVIYTASWLNQKTTRALKSHNISWQQFNILRILRGMYPQPATIKTLTERMIDKMSNASRLVDKLEDKAWVERTTCENDRRQVDIFITKKGLALLEEASYQLENNMEDYMESITKEEAMELNRILDKLRG